MTVRWVQAVTIPSDEPKSEDWDDIQRIVDASPRPLSRLALLGDKRFLLHPSRDAFLMFGEQGKSSVSLGSPVGPPQSQADLAWDFVELCDFKGRSPVFYQISDENLSLYVELGLSPLKIGEDARVLLSSFNLEGGMRKTLRRINRQVEGGGCALHIIPPQDVMSLMPQLREISKTWLARRQTSEKSFSLGYFEPRYIARSPVAIIERQGTPIAFANLWLGADHCEMSVDLLRYHADAPDRVMDFLYIQLMIWGRANGYQWLNLGMVPVEKTEVTSHGARWDRLASLACRHTEHFYDFQGMRQYMSQFDPCWAPTYLASPAGLALPSILTDVANLISRGPATSRR
jgi:phosphatidylglycerol lysyltransferase